MRNAIILFVVFVFFGCNNDSQSSLPLVNYNSEIELFENFADLSSKFYNGSDTTYLVNFWATSCPPCIKEMPLLMKVATDSQKNKVKVLLVSLDLAKDLENRVIPFVNNHQITPEVVLLGDQNYSNWTEKIDSTWYGALPATLIVKGHVKDFSFGAFQNSEEIMQKIKNVQMGFNM